MGGVIFNGVKKDPEMGRMQGYSGNRGYPNLTKIKVCENKVSGLCLSLLGLDWSEK